MIEASVKEDRAPPAGVKAAPAWWGWLAAHWDTVLVLVVAVVLSLVATWYVATHDLLFIYPDSRSRLNIARRVLDNLQPGLAQIGNVWLPLPLLLMLPTIWIDAFWYSGAAGIALSMASYIAAVWYLNRLLEVLGLPRYGRLVGVAILALNPALLYFQSTPLSESLFMALSVAGWYYLANWALREKRNSLHLAGICIGLSSMVRYDGWFSIGTGFVAAMLIVYLGARGSSPQALAARLEGTGLAYLALTIYAPFLWFWYNWVIFRNPLAFLSGPGSAAAFRQQLEAAQGFTNKGSLWNSLLTYGWSMADTVGWLLMALALVGLAIVLWRFGLGAPALIILVTCSGVVFNYITLPTGMALIWHPQVAPDLPAYNIRYGIQALVPVAVCGAALASVRRWVAPLVALVTVIQVWLLLSGPQWYIREPLQADFTPPEQIAAREWFRDNYDGGLVLIDLLTLDGDIFYMHIPMKRFVHIGVQRTYEAALQTPSAFVGWVYVLESDRVDVAVRASPDFEDRFVPVFQQGKMSIYRLKGEE